MKFKKILVVVLAILMGFSFSVKTAKADEGMWLPFLIKRLNYADMQREGLKLTPEEIYSVNHASLKDAIIQLGNGCTGEIISPEGLILTNHHCGYGNIQAHSTVEHDYLTDGFWAKTLEDELPNPGFFVKFLIRMEDVTSKALADVTDDMSEAQRAQKIADNIDQAKAVAIEGTHYEAVVKPFFGGNEYYLFVMETYNDVRLVGAPPSSIGKFGGDTDNWMWPRHTGDFSMFRVYTAPDGSPAKYSPDNIPLKSKYFLPISTKGVQQNDFAMILGYPGRTSRYLSSYGVEYNLKNVYPTRIKIRRKKLDIYDADMKTSEKVRIQYSSKHARVSNYWKNFIGMSRGLKRLHVADQKRQTELAMKTWILEYPSRMKKYGNVLKDIKDSYETMAAYATERYYYYEAVYYGVESFGIASKLKPLADELGKENPDAVKVKELKVSLLKYAENFYKNYNLSTDKKLFTELMRMYRTDVPIEQQPFLFTTLSSKYKNDYEKMAEKFYGKTIFSSLENFKAFLNKPNLKTLKKDNIYNLAMAFNENHKKVDAMMRNAKIKLAKADRLYIDALRKMDKDMKYYPDANFTMRLTYGQVKDYYPTDAVHFKYFTTLKGIMEKEDPTNDEFIVPEKLKEIYRDKAYGNYGEDNTMKVCFLTNNDITGGNSGSPVINGNGELIGLAFDGNWEAMSGDIAFEPKLQRTISVDIRYVLLIIDKYAGATNLIDEMKLVGKVIK